MKKIILTSAILFCFIFSFSQNFYKVIKSTYSEYEYGSWDIKKSMYPEDMYITINKFDIRINNNAESHYKTFGNPEKNYYTQHKCLTWNCLDKDGTSCLFLMKQFNDGTLIMSFLYLRENMMFEYVIDTN